MERKVGVYIDGANLHKGSSGLVFGWIIRNFVDGCGRNLVLPKFIYF